jgi:enterochelin esterase-like enzyme
MRSCFTLAALCLLICVSVLSQTKFIIPYPTQFGKQPLDGRLLLLMSTNNKAEPRFQISDGPQTQQVFGMNVDGWKPGETKTIDAKAFGYPVETMKQLKSGTYYIQVVLHKYETFKRKDGHTVKLPMDRGEGQHWNEAPGNLYNKPVQLRFNASGTDAITIQLDSEIPPIEEPKDTKYIKHIKIQSKLLTEFWGRPMYLGAHVLLPEGWDTHTTVKYPLAIFHGHFPSDFGGFRTTPPDENLKPDYIARFNLTGYNKIVQQEAYDFYKLWTGPNFPRVIAIEIQHATPYYDDSYAVNSANNGPYGDAIVHELIPEIEKRFRGIGEGWARFMYGGSTGGWEVLAAQMFYPDEFNGCYSACPDPIDFRAYTVVDIYKDKNAYYLEGPFRKTARPSHRNYLGHIDAYVRDSNLKELAMGTNSRSGDQWDVWESVYSPVGVDGYPQPIWNKYTGEIDSTVARYWKENYDLGYILERDWHKFGNKLKGKIKIYCGDMDNYYLNNAVYLFEERLKKLTNPLPDAFVDYGDRAEHCWNGDHTQPNYISRLRYNQMFITRWAEEVKTRSPLGADLKSWRY